MFQWVLLRVCISFAQCSCCRVRSSALKVLCTDKYILRVARCPVFDRTVRFFGHLSGQKYNTKPDNKLSNVRFLANLENCTKFGQFILSKIIKIVATSCQISRLKCTKFDFGWGSAPDPAGGAYSAPPDPLAGFNGSYF